MTTADFGIRSVFSQCEYDSLYSGVYIEDIEFIWYEIKQYTDKKIMNIIWNTYISSWIHPCQIPYVYLF